MQRSFWKEFGIFQVGIAIGMVFCIWLMKHALIVPLPKVVELKLLGVWGGGMEVMFGSVLYVNFYLSRKIREARQAEREKDLRIQHIEMNTNTDVED